MKKHWAIFYILLAGCSYNYAPETTFNNSHYGSLMLNMDCKSGHIIYIPDRKKMIICNDRNYHLDHDNSIAIDISNIPIDGIYFERLKFFVKHRRNTALTIIARDDQVIYFDNVDFFFNGALLINSKGLIHLVSTSGKRISTVFDGGSISAQNINFFNNRQ